jgi:hypothetical protein
MLRYLKWAFRPAVLIAVSVGLVGAAALVVLPPWHGAGRPLPLPVGPDEQEIAWLYPATTTTTWERLATAVGQARARLQEAFPGLEWEQDSVGATSALATPQLALSWPGRGQGRLVFRWYKLTSQAGPREWVQALLARRRPPLAIIGGNNSYWARELAVELERATRELPEAGRPLLLLTTATADRVPRAGEGGEELDPPVSQLLWDNDARTVPVPDIYPGRTFRFCFSNRQMATAVTRFLWGRHELRPDSDPAYLVQWTDDSYSQDLFAGYRRVLEYRAADNFVQQWGFVTGCVGLGVPPVALAGWDTSGYRHEATAPFDVDSSVGSFATPNPYEARAVSQLLEEVQSEREGAARAGRAPARRPLLVVTGQQLPSRRLLRDLARSAPDTARHFVVVMGDAVSFNTIYRDRQVIWPIQDLPFTLVFFAHRNPIDTAAGFRPIAASAPERTQASGTDDLLLFRDLVEAVALAFRRGERPGEDAGDLARGLLAVRLHAGRLTTGTQGLELFGTNGQRAGGTGEHVVLLRPSFKGARVEAEATIEVWERQGDRSWRRCEPTLTVSYDEFKVHHGDRFPGS